MERRVSWKVHARCGAGENLEIVSKGYLSLYVDWVFYNATGGEYIIGHGGGALAQHTYCMSISWEEALPGDLVFYPDDVHVGIVGGRDENGNLLIIHCACGANNVVITRVDGFTSVARPLLYDEHTSKNQLVQSAELWPSGRWPVRMGWPSDTLTAIL